MSRRKEIPLGALHRRLELHGAVALVVMNAELPLFCQGIVISFVLRGGLAQGILGPADGAVDVCAVVDRDCLVDYVALDMASGIDVHVNAADRADNSSTDE